MVPLEAPVNITVYLRGTEGESGLVALSGEQRDAGVVYVEDRFVYGEVAVGIGDVVYRLDRENPNPDDPHQYLPDPYRLEIEFSDDLPLKVYDEVGFNPKTGEFWVGKLKCNSQRSAEQPYRFTVKIYAGDELKSNEMFSFGVQDTPTCE